MFWLHIIGVGSWTNEHFNNTYESAGDNNSKEGIHRGRERAWREEGEKEWVRERKTETEMERESERQRRGRKGERGELTKAYQKKITAIIIIDCHYFSVTVDAGKEGDGWESEKHSIF